MDKNEFEQLVTAIDGLEKAAEAVLKTALRLSWEASFSANVLQATTRLNGDLDLRRRILQPHNHGPSPAEVKRAKELQKNKGHREHYHEPGEATNHYKD